MESVRTRFLIFIICCIIAYKFIGDWLKPQQNMESSAAKMSGLLHGGKINSAGEYQQFCGFTILSKCHNIETLKYLEEFIENSHVLRKIISPLPYTSYHMTTYSIYANSRKPIKFVQDWLNGDPVRTSTHEKCIPSEAVYPIMKRAQKVWDATGKERFTVLSDQLKIWTSVLVIEVSLDDNILIAKLDEARLQWDKVFDKTSKHPHLHVSLGYIYSNVEDLSKEDQIKFEQEFDELQKLLPKTFTMNPPVVTSFLSMKEFTPIVNE
ncbi:uncharacterized protein [Amphiura filiformis]|uniref:uncharacterized protein n=1 Tax=Amphiura filiformis TaxID=82378 RepID=UPI003B20F2E1